MKLANFAILMLLVFSVGFFFLWRQEYHHARSAWETIDDLQTHVGELVDENIKLDNKLFKLEHPELKEEESGEEVEPEQPPKISLSQTLYAIAAVESNRRENAHNVSEDAVGYFQIRKCVVDDLKSWGYQFTYNDRWDRIKSLEMATIYLSRYGSKKRIGREPVWSDWARIWNGGPNGFRKQSPKKEAKLQTYTQKVKAELRG